MSCCELFFDEVVSDARVLERPRNSGELDEVGELKGELGEGRE